MALHCAISNQVPENPVVSPVSGCIFERRLIEKFISENGTDPINGDVLKTDELIEVKTPSIVKAKPPSATSIPAILKSLQDEWDATMLHTFSLRQQLQTVRQELSHALYQHDAACRVIARLNKELISARGALATVRPQSVIPQAAGAAQPVAVPDTTTTPTQQLTEAGLTPEIVQKLQDTGNALTAQRKQRGKAIPEDLTPAENIKNFKTLASHAGLHSAGTPGILAVDVHAADTGKLVTGGNDKTVAVFNKDSEQVVSVLKGHTKRVTHVIYHPTEDMVVSASPDATIRVWDVPSSEMRVLLRAHAGAITGLSLHATGDYVLSTSSDEHWAFSDIRAGRLLTRGTSGVPLTSAQFHPDGLIFATGSGDSTVRIWDLKERNNVANFPGHTGPITAISFSENGYYLATAAADASVKLWDLRKLKNFKSIALDQDYEIKDVCFDQSGTYLAVAGTDVRVYLCKQWQELKVFNDHTALATGVRFGKNSSYIASVSMDRTLKIYGQ